MDTIADVLSDLVTQCWKQVTAVTELEFLEAGTDVDLLITDVGLPGGMNGRQLADAARERRPNLNVLFVTGYAEILPVGSGFAAQGVQVMTKPLHARGASSQDTRDHRPVITVQDIASWHQGRSFGPITAGRPRTFPLR